MPDLRIWRKSKPYIYAAVTAASDPTSKPVTMAIKVRGTEPLDADFKPADWDPATKQARILIGPGSPDIGELAPGFYNVWTKVDDNPEDPGFPAADLLVIYDTP